MQGSNSGSRLRAFRSWFLVFWAVLIGLLFSRVPPLSAEWRPSADSARVVAHYPFRAMITAAAMGEGVDPALVEAVVAVESAFSPRAVSHKVAMGLNADSTATTASTRAGSTPSPIAAAEG